MNNKDSQQIQNLDFKIAHQKDVLNTNGAYPTLEQQARRYIEVLEGQKAALLAKK
jgi:hypothetical protein